VVIEFIGFAFVRNKQAAAKPEPKPPVLSKKPRTLPGLLIGLETGEKFSTWRPPVRPN